MKTLVHLILVVSLMLSFSSVTYADDQVVQLIGREIYAGREMADGTVRGALFVGKFFSEDFGTELGRFTVILDHNNVGIEECGGETKLRRFKLILNFHSGARLVLLGPRSEDGVVKAQWVYNDPGCPDGNCPLINYGYYIGLFDSDDLYSCGEGGNSFIAGVPEFGLRRQWLGSYGTSFIGGLVSGYLVHTPIISPAIFGSLQLR